MAEASRGVAGDHFQEASEEGIGHDYDEQKTVICDVITVFIIPG